MMKNLVDKIIVLANLIATYVLHLCHSSGDHAVADDASPTVIIVGAGMSGISAAKRLSEAGIRNVLILEATDRIGGRMKKSSFGGETVEMGAHWVEGVGGPKMNPIWGLAKELKLKTFKSDFDTLISNTYKQSGGTYTKEAVEKAFKKAEEVVEFATKVSHNLSANKEDDISIQVAQHLSNQVLSTPLEMVVDYYTYDYESGEQPKMTSLKNTMPLPTFSNFGEDLYLVADPRGYENVVHFLANKFLTTDKSGLITDPRLLLNKVVTEIRYSPSGVVVKTEDGCVYKATYAMVSVSIGVLQTKLINFQPNLPKWKVHAINQLGMSIYTRIFLKFPYKFWPSGEGTEWFLYAHEKRGYYPIWQHLERAYPGSNILMVTVTNDESLRIEQQNDSATMSEVMEVLRDMFGQNIPEATDILVPRWWSDKFYKGAFSNCPVGVSRSRIDHIRVPVVNVYFTGEHTSRDYNGYVHGAYLAGIDSADMLIRCARKRHTLIM